MATHPSILAWRILWTQEPGVLQSMGSQRAEHHWVTAHMQCYTAWEVANILRISKSSTEDHLHQLGHGNCFGVWSPHKLSEETLLDCISACDCLLKHNENIPFLKHIVTGDEKWIWQNNVEQKRMWGKAKWTTTTTWKTGLHQEKVMLCICWDWKGDLYYLLLLENQTIDSNKYYSIRPTESSTSQKLSRSVNRKHKIFHLDNARTCVSLITRQKLL